jgi:hypothetical protein
MFPTRRTRNRQNNDNRQQREKQNKSTPSLLPFPITENFPQIRRGRTHVVKAEFKFKAGEEEKASSTLLYKKNVKCRERFLC